MGRKVPNLVKKGNSYYFRMRVPQALIAAYGGKKEVWVSLGAVAWSQAAGMARKLTAQYDEEFQRAKHRLGALAHAPQPSPVVRPRRVATVEEVTLIARAVAQQRVATDDELRAKGNRSQDVDVFTSLMADKYNDIDAFLQFGRLDLVLPDFQADLAAHDLTEPEDPDDLRRLVRAWAQEHWKGLEAIRRRNHGEIVETPPPVVIGSARRMRDAYEAWKSAAVRPEKTERTFNRYVEIFEEMMGDPPLGSLTRADGMRFRDKLQEWAVAEKKTARTADNVLAGIKAMANVARDRGWIETSPFERMEVARGGRESEGREPWTHEELVVLFDSPLFTRYELPETAKAGRDAAYWVPLLAAYTGARAGELCQLWVDDVSEQEGGLVIEFRANAKRGQKLKNKGSWRAVPVHSELVRLGFHEYWRAQKAAGAQRLFPHIPIEGQNGAAGQFGHWFGTYKRTRGFESPTKTLHSFRHTVVTELALAGVEEVIRHAITGHEGNTVHDKVYAATIRRQAERLRAYVEKIKYPGLVLPRVYSRPEASNAALLRTVVGGAG